MGPHRWEFLLAMGPRASDIYTDTCFFLCRGYLTRKHLEAQGIHVRSGGASPTSSASPTSPNRAVGQHNHVGDDGIGSPGDAEEAAATKIQAAFRGHMVRQQYMKGHDNEGGDFV